MRAVIMVKQTVIRGRAMVSQWRRRPLSNLIFDHFFRKLQEENFGRGGARALRPLNPPMVTINHQSFV